MTPSAAPLAPLALVAIAALGLPGAGAERPQPHAPTLVAPADDGTSGQCLHPDASDGIRFDWSVDGDGTAANGYPVESYIDIRRRDADGTEWRPWVKRYARPPFTMNVRPNTYDADFAWRVWAVDRSGEARPYATPSEWRLFCTAPMPEPPAYGSSVPPE
jgi:hypothetical protein